MWAILFLYIIHHFGIGPIAFGVSPVSLVPII